MTLWLERALRPKPLWFWFVLHVAALVLQLACVRAAPLAFQHTNGAGWWAMCLTAKGP